ncbi:MAG: AAA family ATPase, partial [Chloroflexi bacterium]|nr:AAA family ATPase [Chloroflexota bacterium]MCL5273851.1 AAA family ATPase [Chloroflexota bacterium]
MITRTILVETIQQKLEANRVTALIGPRQCGKTTLARGFVSPNTVNYLRLGHNSSDRLHKRFEADVETQTMLETIKQRHLIDEDCPQGKA